MAKARRNGKGLAFWRRKINEYERAGLIQRDFCEAAGLDLGTFRRWRRKLRDEESRKVGEPQQEVTTAGFLEVVEASEVSDVGEPGAQSQRQGCVVRLEGAEIEFGAVPEPGYLAELLAGMGVRGR